jgi:hypothetical protein
VSSWCRGELALATAIDLAIRALFQTRPEDPLAAQIAPLALLTQSDQSWLAAWQAPHLALFRVSSRKHYDAVAQALLAARRDSSG